MKYHKKQDVFLITGKQLNLCIWSLEQLMDLFQNNDDMLIRLGRLRERLINKITYSEILDKMGIPQAPKEDEVTLVEFLNGLGITLPPPEEKE